MTAPARQEFAERLLKGSVKKSYAPVVDIDWDAPLDPDKFFLPAKTVSLYGTPIWDSMSREQQIELSREELVNTLSAGIWFENILNQALLRKMMHQDPTASATHYELTELGDETRHMVMFGKAIERVDAKPVRPRYYQRFIINLLPFAFQGPVLWVAALIGEEIFDSLQRQMMDDPELQPMVQRLMRIHVTEEARHIQFARDGLRKRTPHMRWAPKFFVANVNGLGGYFFRLPVHQQGPLPPRRTRRPTGTPGRTAQPAPPRNPGRRIRAVGGFSPRGRADGADCPSHVAAQRFPAAMSDIYDGPATIRDGDEERTVRVRLSGHLEPIDGRYHWQGTVFESLPDGAKLPQQVILAVGENRAEARITERTPQGGYSVAGVGAPPFALDDLEVDLPVR